MTSDEKKSTMKRTRKWFTTAFVVMATVIVELDKSVAFSPASETRPKNNGDRRRPKRVGSSRFTEDDSTNIRNSATATGTDLNVAMSPSMPNTYQTSDNGRIKKSSLISRVIGPKQIKRPTDIHALPSSSRVVSPGKRNRNSRMVRPISRNSSPQLDGKTVALDHDGLLDKAQEQKLTVCIRSLRRAVKIRDKLLETTETIPTEAEWAEACNLSVIGLRRVMYEGQQARTILVSANAGLVTSVAKRHYASLKYATQAGGGVGTILTIQDLIQEGNLGLMQAAERFDVDRGFRFSTYATYWIKQRILRSISDSSRIIRLPAHGKILIMTNIEKADYDSL